MSVHDLDRYDSVREILGIPEGEPIFILRAQDKLSHPILVRYRNLARQIEAEDKVRTEEWFDSLDAHIESFVDWQGANKKLVKLPD